MSGRKTNLEREVEQWERNGPFTFAKTLELAIKCAKSDEIQIGDSLDFLVHNYPPDELRKLLNPQDYCPPKQMHLWEEGTDDWALGRMNYKLSDDQLEVLAHADKKSRIGENFLEDVQDFDPDHKLQFLKVYRSFKRSQASNRDDSPERS